MVFMTRADSTPSCSGAPRLYIRQKPRATRGLACSHFAPVRRCVGGYGPRGARYRRARRFTCHQLSDGGTIEAYVHRIGLSHFFRLSVWALMTKQDELGVRVNKE